MNLIKLPTANKDSPVRNAIQKITQRMKVNKVVRNKKGYFLAKMFTIKKIPLSR